MKKSIESMIGDEISLALVEKLESTIPSADAPDFTPEIAIACQEYAIKYMKFLVASRDYWKDTAENLKHRIDSLEH